MIATLERVDGVQLPRATVESLRWRPTDGWIVAALTVTVLAITELPLIFGYLSTPNGLRFMGILLNVPDTAQYLSWARESTHSVFIENKLTSEHGPPVFFNLFWFIVGRLAVTLSIGLSESTQIARLVAGCVYILAIYWFAGLFFGDRIRRWTSTLVAVLGGGLGWLLVVQKQATGAADVAFPLDVYVTEANTFLSVMAFPLQAMAGGLVVLMLGLAVLAFERASVRLAVIAGAAGVLIGLMHGYDLILAYAVVGSMTLVHMFAGRDRVRALVLGALVCGLSVPTALYNVYVTSTSPIWKGVLAQYGNAGVFTPSPPHLLILLGLPLLFTMGGLVPILSRPNLANLRNFPRGRPAREFVLWAWFFIGFFLLYIPTNYQIKMLVGWQIPLSFLGTRAVFMFAEAARRQLSGSPRRWIVPAAASMFVLAVLPTNAYLLSWRFVELSQHKYPYYLHQDETQALEWLMNNSVPRDVVLSSLTVGQYVPSVSGNQAFLAHWAETLDFNTKRSLVSAFFAPATTDAVRASIVENYQVQYVFYGPAEVSVGSYNPDDASFLSKVYENTTVSVYRVETVALAGTAQ